MKVKLMLAIFSMALAFVGSSCQETNLQEPSITRVPVFLLVDEIELPGSYQAFWNQRTCQGVRVAPGTYAVHMTAGEAYEGEDMFQIWAPPGSTQTRGDRPEPDIGPGGQPVFSIMVDDTIYAPGDTITVEWSVAESTAVTILIEKVIP